MMAPIIRIALLVFLLGSELSFSKSFDINDLDVGKAVTLPHPARTKIGASHTVMLSSTDRGQTIKLSSLGAKGSTMVIAIFDPHADGVRRIKLTPGAPVVYAFKSLGSIRIKVESAINASVEIESNRPLELRNLGG